MIDLNAAGTSLEAVARLIQLSLTPVFLLSALASLLGVFAVRLARVADRVDQIATELETAPASQTTRLTEELAYHRRRTLALDVAVVVGAFGGVLTGAAVLALFLGALTGARVATLLFVLFGGAILAAIAALAAFVYEMLLASRGVRRRSRAGVLRSLVSTIAHHAHVHAHHHPKRDEPAPRPQDP